MRRLPLLAMVLLGALASSFAHAQLTGAAQPVSRYHFGDDPRWADPALDDTEWPVAEAGHLPAPPFNSDGYEWLRVRIPVPAGLSGPLALQTSGDAVPVGAVQIYVSGAAVERIGHFPLHAEPGLVPPIITSPLDPAVAQRGQIVTVALRAWSPPAQRVNSPARTVAFSIDRASVLDTAARANRSESLLGSLPMLVPNLLLILLGFALLTLWPAMRNRELLLNALWLITLPMYITSLLIWQAGLVSTSFRVWLLIFFFLRIPGFWVTVELIWTVHRVPSRFSRVLTHACWIAYLVPELIANLADRPASWIPPFVTGSFDTLVLFNVLCLGANVWALFVARRNRFIAVAFTLVNIPFLLRAAGIPINITIGTVAIDGQIIGFFFAGIAITAMLVRQAIAAWAAGRKLRVEFDAAREVQQRLVPLALPPVPGYTMAAAYIPAAEVGGDFYQILPQSGGATLIVVGDVSGKGLKAAMTGVLAIGALRTLAAEGLSPAELLRRMNHQLLQTQDCGFVTCLCARINSFGALTIANAGHLIPYRNGDEVPLESGLPLGISVDATYAESSIGLAPNDQLTFLSDGVVEAQNAQREIFGFDRTRQISTHSAESIAQAAQQFGQEDDITVLTLNFVPSEVMP